MPSESLLTAADLIAGCLLHDSVLPASLEPCLTGTVLLEEDPRALLFRRGGHNHRRLNNVYIYIWLNNNAKAGAIC